MNSALQKKSEGFSLVDVTISIAILSIISLSVAQLVVPVASQSRLNKEANIANNEARAILEKIQATPFNELLTTYPEASEIPITELPAGKLTIHYEDPEADPLLIRVDLAWTSPNQGDITRTFFTARTE